MRQTAGVLALLLTACSEKQVYDGLRDRNRAECYQRPVAQQHDCIEQTESMPYQQYREALKKAAD